MYLCFGVSVVAHIFESVLLFYQTTCALQALPFLINKFTNWGIYLSLPVKRELAHELPPYELRQWL